MVLSESRTSGVEPALTGRHTPAQVVWHDLECGSYRVDLALWRELARSAGGPILDIGAGTGRVSLELAREGHAVTALDREEELLQALRLRASGVAIETVCADARSLSLSRRDYALCIVPMQTIQLLGGSAGRIAFLDAARAHLRRGARIACAILGELEPFDCSDSAVGPAPEQAIVDGLLYTSRALRVAESHDEVVIERERRIAQPSPGARDARSEATLSLQRETISLDRLSAASIEREAREVGLIAEPPRRIEATDEHVGSVVVMLRV